MEEGESEGNINGESRGWAASCMLPSPLPRTEPKPGPAGGAGRAQLHPLAVCRPLVPVPHTHQALTSFGVGEQLVADGPGGAYLEAKASGGALGHPSTAGAV